MKSQLKKTTDCLPSLSGSILMHAVVYCRVDYALIPDSVFHSCARCQQNERALLLLSIQSKNGKAVNCMAPLPLML